MHAKSEPARDVIYADLDDEVTTLVARVRRARCREVVLVLPARAQILQSLVSLKILRHKAEFLAKNLLIVTRDFEGRTLATEAGLATAERVEIKGKKVSIENFKPATRQEISQVVGDKKAKGLGRKLLKITESASRAAERFKQISREEIPLADPVSSVRSAWQKVAGGVTELADSEAGTRFVVRAPSRVVLAGLIGAAVLLLFFIIYIAVPTATIYVTPRADPISKVANVSIVEQVSTLPGRRDTHQVSGEFFDFQISQDIAIPATGQIFDGTLATGRVTLYNRSPRDKFLVPSRLLSVRDQLIFRTKRAVTIPQAIGEVPGEIEVEVISVEKNDTKCDSINNPDSCEGKFVGHYGNIEPAFFTFPAIPSLSPSLYWGESTESFTGGSTEITKFITAEDLENVEATVVQEVEKLARVELNARIADLQQLGDRELTPLFDRRTLVFEIQSLTVPPGLVDSLQNEFTVAVTARIQGVAYATEELRTLLLSELESKVHPEKSLTKIAFDNLAVRVEQADLETRDIRLAVGVDGIEEFEFSELSEEGSRLVEKIRNRILGRPVSEAERYIRNLPEINNAVISSWPFWARTVPELTENVNFKVRK